MPSKPGSSSYKEPPRNQKGLDSFLGTLNPPKRQRTLAFGIAAAAANHPPLTNPRVGESSIDNRLARNARIKGEEEVEMKSEQANKQKMEIDSEEDEKVSLSKGTKRKNILPSSDAEAETSPPKKIKFESAKSASQPAINPTASTSPSKSASKETSTSKPIASIFDKPKPKPASEKKPNSAAASFFQPRKPAEKNSHTAENGKGKGKASSEEAEREGSVASAAAKDAANEAGEETDGEESQEDEEAAHKFAEIFTRKDSDKSSSNKIGDWAAGEAVPYAALTAAFDRISKTTKRLEITQFLTEFLLRVIEKTPADLLPTIYLCINRLCPDYEALELGIGESILMKAIGESTGRKLADIRADLKKIGDLGQVAQNSRDKQKTLFKPKVLTVPQVFKGLKEIAKSSGKDSQARKVGLINKLLAACVGVETKFLIRSLEGKLRIGLAERTVITSLAQATIAAESAKTGKNLSREKIAQKVEQGTNELKAVFSELPSYDLVVPALLEFGILGLRQVCHLTPGVPLKPMLAKPTKAISEVLDRFEGKPFTCEYKYDGERAQVHYLENGTIKVFSRNSEDMSVKYPDIVKQLPAAIVQTEEIRTTSFVLDCEAVAWDKDEKKLLPFQELSRRKRKDVKAEEITVKVHLFAFDLLFLNGEPLLNSNLQERRILLQKHLNPVAEEFGFATSDDATSVEEIQVFLDESVKSGCEGLMVKMLQGEGATYEPSRRSIHWLKLKKDYLAGVGDSFDLVVVGADFGTGKRTGVYGAFHLACFDEESQTFQAICKIGTGFSDEALKNHHERLIKGKLIDADSEEFRGGELTKKPGEVDFGTVAKQNLPNVYFDPQYSIVWEVLAADLSLSPIYSAAMGRCDETRGISLRFPRFLRVRDDKNPEDATDAEQVAEAYRRQAITSKAGKFGKKGAGADQAADDFW